MNTKLCKICGKELPQEVTFCPYCMTKLIDVTTGKEIKVKKKNYVFFILMVLLFAIIAVCVAVLFIFQNKLESEQINKTTESSVATAETTTEEHTTSADNTDPIDKSSAYKTNENATMVTETATEETTVEIDKINKVDYSGYIGIWCDKNSNIDGVTQNGGNLLEIISVKDNIVRFTFTKTSSAPYNRIARIGNVTSEIIDNVGTFTFDDDNWGNSGVGKIKLLNGEIYLETTLLNTDDNAMWNIGGRVYLAKSKSSTIDFKDGDYLNKDFDDVRNIFGEEISETFTASDKWDIHSYSGFEVTVLKATNKIVSITVSYSPNKLTKSNLCYGNINGNSTYDDVYAEMGEPIYNNISYGDVSYISSGNYINFFFNENMNLTEFTLQLENTH